MAGSPTTATLVASTAQTVTLDGVWNSVEVVPLAAGQVVFALGTGGTATAGTGLEYACPPARATRVPAFSTNGTTTAVSIISATAGQVQVRAPLGGDEPQWA